jgi:hypothetical protein
MVLTELECKNTRLHMEGLLRKATSRDLEILTERPSIVADAANHILAERGNGFYHFNHIRGMALAGPTQVTELIKHDFPVDERAASLLPQVTVSDRVAEKVVPYRCLVRDLGFEYSPRLREVNDRVVRFGFTVFPLEYLATFCVTKRSARDKKIGGYRLFLSKPVTSRLFCLDRGKLRTLCFGLDDRVGLDFTLLFTRR